MTDENKEVQTAQAEAQQPAGPDLTIADLGALRAIIDIASQRGAFKAGELEVVGKTFNKLNAFLEAAAKTAQPQEGQ